MKHTLIIFALITATIQTFAQSPRIKLNQITKDSLSGSVLISSPTDSGMVYSRDLYISYGADTVLILNGDTLAATSGIINSVLSDGVTIVGDGTTGSELTVDTATVIATKQDLDSKQDQLNGTGFVKATGTTISYDNSTYLTTEVDGSVTNEIQDISTTGAAGNISISSGSTLNLNVDDADASATNEGSLTVGAGTASTSVISSNTSGSTDVTLTAGTNVTLSESGNNITIAASGGGTTYNNITETADTLYITDYLDVDTSTLYVDASTNRVGIGTSEPGYGVEVSVVPPATNNISRSVIISNDAPSPNNTVVFGLNTKESNANFGFLKNDSIRIGMTYDGRGFFGIVNTEYDNRDFSLRLEDDGDLSYFDKPSNSTSFLIQADGDVYMPRFYNTATTGSAANLFIASDGKLYRSTSSIRYKTNVRNYDKGIDLINQLRPVYYQGINDGTNIYAGFIAEEFDELGLNEFVQYQNGIPDAINYSNITALLTKAIQEQQAIIEQQANEIETLKALITELSNRLTIIENK